MPYKDLEARRRYGREWIARRRTDFFADKVCTWCGSSGRLELDHIDPAGKVSHKIWSWSEPRRLAEIAKCQVLCEPCHVKKTRDNGEHAKGESNGLAKLTEVQVKEGLEMYATGDFTFKEIGERFGVHKDTFRKIWKGKSWMMNRAGVPGPS